MNPAVWRVYPSFFILFLMLILFIPFSYANLFGDDTYIIKKTYNSNGTGNGTGGNPIFINDTTTDASRFIPFVADDGEQQMYINYQLRYNPNTRILNVPKIYTNNYFTGEAYSTAYKVPFTGQTGYGFYSHMNVDTSGFTYNPSTDVLAVGRIDASRQIVGDTSTNNDFPILFASAVSTWSQTYGSNGVGGFSWNPGTGEVKAPYFIGNGSGLTGISGGGGGYGNGTVIPSDTPKSVIKTVYEMKPQSDKGNPPSWYDSQFAGNDPGYYLFDNNGEQYMNVIFEIPEDYIEENAPMEGHEPGLLFSLDITPITEIKSQEVTISFIMKCTYDDNESVNDYTFVDYVDDFTTTYSSERIPEWQDIWTIPYLSRIGSPDVKPNGKVSCTIRRDIYNSDTADDVSIALIEAKMTYCVKDCYIGYIDLNLSDIQENASMGAEAYGWGNHADEGYITDGNTGWENNYGLVNATNHTHPDYWNVSGITTSELLTNASNGQTAYGWGNHASAGYVTGTPWTGLGYITDGNTGWENNYGFVTAINHTHAQYGNISGKGVIGQLAYFDTTGTVANAKINYTSTMLKFYGAVAEPTIVVHNTGGGGGATLQFIDDASGSNFKFKAISTGGFKIRDNTNSKDVMSIENNASANSIYIDGSAGTEGFVGIGTTSPSSKLEVNGNIEIIRLLDSDNSNFFDGSADTNEVITGISEDGTLTFRNITDHLTSTTGLGKTVLASTVTVTSTAVYQTVFTVTPPASKNNILEFHIIAKTGTAGATPRFRVRSADAGNVGYCTFTSYTTATAQVLDTIAIASNPSNTGETAVIGTSPYFFPINCAFTSDGTPGDVILEIIGETADTNQALQGSYYTMVSG